MLASESGVDDAGERKTNANVEFAHPPLSPFTSSLISKHLRLYRSLQRRRAHQNKRQRMPPPPC